MQLQSAQELVKCSSYRISATYALLPTIPTMLSRSWVALPSNMFSTVTLPATLWFFDKNKPNTDRKDEILFIDARSIFTQVDRAHRKFSDEQIKNLSIITRLYEGDTSAYSNLINEYKNSTVEEDETQISVEHNKTFFEKLVDLYRNYYYYFFIVLILICGVALLVNNNKNRFKL